MCGLHLTGTSPKTLHAVPSTWMGEAGQVYNSFFPRCSRCCSFIRRCPPPIASAAVRDCALFHHVIYLQSFERDFLCRRHKGVWWSTKAHRAIYSKHYVAAGPAARDQFTVTAWYIASPSVSRPTRCPDIGHRTIVSPEQRPRNLTPYDIRPPIRGQVSGVANVLPSGRHCGCCPVSLLFTWRVLQSL